MQRDSRCAERESPTEPRPSTALALGADAERTSSHEPVGVPGPPRRRVRQAHRTGHRHDRDAGIDGTTDGAAVAGPRPTAALHAPHRGLPRSRRTSIATTVARVVPRRDLGAAGASAHHRRLARQASTTRRSSAGGRRSSSQVRAIRSRTARGRWACRRRAHVRQSPCSVSADEHRGHGFAHLPASARVSEEARAGGGSQGKEVSWATSERSDPSVSRRPVAIGRAGGACEQVDQGDAEDDDEQRASASGP